MWEMLDNVFNAIGRGGKVIDLSMEKTEMKVSVEVAAIKQVLTEPDVLEGILAKTRKDYLKDLGTTSDEFNPFAALRVEKEATNAN